MKNPKPPSDYTSGDRSLINDSEAMLGQALEALVRGDTTAAADAARLALAGPHGPDEQARAGWATWLLGLSHLYNTDTTGAAPYLQRAHDLALQAHQPTLAMAVYMAQQFAASYQQQSEVHKQAARLIKQLEEQETRLTQQFQAMLRFARDSWPALTAGGVVPTLPDGTARVIVPRSQPPPAALPPLRAAMLGPFRVTAGEQEVALRQSRKAADILKYMLAHRARPAAKDTLLGLLWPDVETKIATHRLHLAISGLRQLLGAAGVEGPGYVIFRDDAYFFNPLATIEVDVDRFLEYARQGQALDRAGRPGEALAPYEAAVELYHDDYLIDNIYDDWTANTRTHLRDTYLGLLARLSEGYLEAGRPGEALAAARQMLIKDPYREDAHRCVMTALNQQGQRNQALLQYQLCEEVLGADLGVAPTAQTTALYEQLKAEES